MGTLNSALGLLDELVQTTSLLPERTKVRYYGDDSFYWLMAEALHFHPCSALSKRDRICTLMNLNNGAI